jgi:hypothetical protein
MTESVDCKSDIEFSEFDDTLELLKISFGFSCSRSFSDTLLRFEKFDASIRAEILFPEDIRVFSFRELVGGTVKSTRGISSVKRDDV